MFNGKRFIAVLMLAVTMSFGVQFTEPTKAEAGFLDGLLGDIIKSTIEHDVYRNYDKMERNYYAAAYYSSYAAECGSQLLSKYGANVEMREAQLLNASSDNRSEAIDIDTKNMRIKKFKTDVTDFDSFTCKIDVDDPLLKEFVMYRKCQRKALNEANTAIVALLAERAILDEAAAGVAECIIAAIEYQSVRSALERESGNVTMNALEKAIDSRFKNLKISDREVKEAIKSVSRG